MSAEAPRFAFIGGPNPNARAPTASPAATTGVGRRCETRLRRIRTTRPLLSVKGGVLLIQWNTMLSVLKTPKKSNGLDLSIVLQAPLDSLVRWFTRAFHARMSAARSNVRFHRPIQHNTHDQHRNQGGRSGPPEARLGPPLMDGPNTMGVRLSLAHRVILLALGACGGWERAAFGSGQGDHDI